ncbi:YjbH domain-containing protein [Prodigiosinella confusarubida]|uniref:YjbH domain-containing protein n=1 Tax=Serratia sp. (strain ATCC 39006) TaxID=104623 RepID=UPI00040C0176
MEQFYTQKALPGNVNWQTALITQASIGFRDIAGSGLFDSEYVVSSKRFGAFDFTMGIG